jgi:hypothetical protein
LRYFGGLLIRDALLRKERAEDQGRDPGPISSFLAGIPERVGVQVGR